MNKHMHYHNVVEITKGLLIIIVLIPLILLMSYNYPLAFTSVTKITIYSKFNRVLSLALANLVYKLCWMDIISM